MRGECQVSSSPPPNLSELTSKRERRGEELACFLETCLLNLFYDNWADYCRSLRLGSFCRRGAKSPKRALLLLSRFLKSAPPIIRGLGGTGGKKKRTRNQHNRKRAACDVQQATPTNLFLSLRSCKRRRRGRNRTVTKRSLN